MRHAAARPAMLVSELNLYAGAWFFILSGLRRPIPPRPATAPLSMTESDHINTTPHLNRSKCKETALEIARATRAQGWTRVGLSFLERIEARTRAAIADEVRMHPSRGKTLL